MREKFRNVILFPALFISGCATFSGDGRIVITDFVHGKAIYNHDKKRHEIVDVAGVYRFEENGTCTYPDIAEGPCMMTGFSFNYELRQPAMELICSISPDSNFTYGNDFERVNNGEHALQYRIKLKQGEHTYMHFHGLRDDGSGIHEATHTTTCKADGKEVITFMQHFVP